MSEPENQSFQQEKVLFTTKKTESRVPSLLKMQGNKKKKKNKWEKIQILAFRAEMKFSRKKAKSRAELKILQLELWLKPARLGLITTTYQTSTAYCW